MPVTVDEGRVPSSWSSRRPHPQQALANASGPRPAPIKIALVNNMPDSALEDTELQFCELLEGAAGDLPVRVLLFSLPELPRNERGKHHINQFYSTFTELLESRFDGAIVTGTEPIQPDLKNEPYWGSLVELLGWAEENTSSTVLSCLAAHAGVLHSDAITRNRLPDKQFGVFAHERAADHILTRGIPNTVHIPHSRWNEVREEELVAHGYTVLTKSADAGVDLFIKEKKKSLFVHFQGHPEYGRLTLLKEYQRDIRRFLKRERATYPSMPAGYFDSNATEVLGAFREGVSRNPDPGGMETFPEPGVVNSLQNSWRDSAVGIYRNWLNYLISRKSGSEIESLARAGRN
jgi:homoserine O-succinyltransferase